VSSVDRNTARPPYAKLACSIYQSVSIDVSVRLSSSLSLSVYLYLFVYLSVCLFIHISARPSVHPLSAIHS